MVPHRRRSRDGIAREKEHNALARAGYGEAGWPVAGYGGKGRRELTSQSRLDP